MKRHKLLRGALIGGGVGMVLTAFFYLGDQLLRLPFFPFNLFDWLARALPGDVVTLGIDTIVDGILLLNIGESTSETAKVIEQLMALLLFVLGVAILKLGPENLSNAFVALFICLIAALGLVPWLAYGVLLGLETHAPGSDLEERAFGHMLTDPVFDGTDLTSGTLHRGLAAWTLVLGAITTELFEQFGAEALPDPDAFFAALLEDATLLVEH